MPMPSSLTVEHELITLRPRPDLDAAAIGGELQRVAHEVVEHAFELPAVPGHDAHPRRDLRIAA